MSELIGWDPRKHDSIFIDSDETGLPPCNGAVVKDQAAFSAAFQEAADFIASPEGQVLYRAVDKRLAHIIEARLAERITGAN